MLVGVADESGTLVEPAGTAWWQRIQISQCLTWPGGHDGAVAAASSRRICGTVSGMRQASGGGAWSGRTGGAAWVSVSSLAHVREVEQFGQSLPEGSYGRRNRQAIAARETRVATRLRAVEHAYRTAIERDTAYRPPEPTRTLRSPELQPGRQIEMEAEP